MILRFCLEKDKHPNMEYHTRSDDGETRNFPNLKDAVEHALQEPSVWKISFDYQGLPFRLTRDSNWKNYPIDEDYMDMLHEHATRLHTDDEYGQKYGNTDYHPSLPEKPIPSTLRQELISHGLFC